MILSNPHFKILVSQLSIMQNYSDMKHFPKWTFSIDTKMRMLSEGICILAFYYDMTLHHSVSHCLLWEFTKANYEHNKIRFRKAEQFDSHPLDLLRSPPSRKHQMIYNQPVHFLCITLVQFPLVVPFEVERALQRISLFFLSESSAQSMFMMVLGIEPGDSALEKSQNLK